MALAVSLNGDLVPIPPSTGGGGAPSGPAGGDLADDYPNPSVAKQRSFSENEQAVASYTLVLTDAGKLVNLSHSSPTLVVPENASVAFPVWTRIVLVNYTGGAFTLSPAVGVTVTTQSSQSPTIYYSLAYLTKVDTDTWIIDFIPWVQINGTANIANGVAGVTGIIKGDGAGDFFTASPGSNYVAGTDSPSTGWSANASAGDKTQVVADYAPPSFSGGDTVDASAVALLATQVQALTKKLQAIEAVLAGGQIPSA